MTKPPTSSARTANACSAFFRVWANEPLASRWSSRNSSPVWTTNPSGHDLAGLGDQLLGVVAAQVVGLVLLLSVVQPVEGVGVADRDGAAAVERVGVAELGDADQRRPSACRPASAG